MPHSHASEPSPNGSPAPCPRQSAYASRIEIEFVPMFVPCDSVAMSIEQYWTTAVMWHVDDEAGKVYRLTVWYVAYIGNTLAHHSIKVVRRSRRKVIIVEMEVRGMSLRLLLLWAKTLCFAVATDAFGGSAHGDLQSESGGNERRAGSIRSWCFAM